MPKERLEEFEWSLRELDLACVEKREVDASELALKVEEILSSNRWPNHWVVLGETVVAVALALLLSLLVRQIWFEPMEIPTGSMRPTFQEQDRVAVSKTVFGVNVPLKRGHATFNPHLVERTGTFIFTSEDMDIPDQETTYFLLFPGKKRLVKRCMGKPGDVLYFYGGKIFGIDREGRDLIELRESPWMEGIEAIPFITFEGKVVAKGRELSGLFTQVLLYQMNILAGRLEASAKGEIKGELRVGDQWVADDPLGPTEMLHTYSQLYGVGNYAMARLLTPNEALQLSLLPPGGPLQLLYLELRHHPSFSDPHPYLGHDLEGRLRPMLATQTSLLPLGEEHLKRLFSHLSTSRFAVRGGYASRVGVQPSALSARFEGVPDGSYEFESGVLYRIGWGGIRTLLPSDHPLYYPSPERIQGLFNLGIDFSRLYEPRSASQAAYPHRYAYYREEALYVMGAPLMSAQDPSLLAFQEGEMRRAESSRPYLPFIDTGPPLKEGKIDLDFIRTFGLNVPECMYMALGDNPPSSGDSRLFGFVPEENLQGAPLFIFWPPGPRWGGPAQKPYPFFNWRSATLWGLVILLVAAYLARIRWRNRHPQFKKLSQD